VYCEKVFLTHGGSTGPAIRLEADWLCANDMSAPDPVETLPPSAGPETAAGLSFMAVMCQTKAAFLSGR